MRLRIFAAALIFVSAFSAHATPITYSVSDTATGTLGSVAFTNTLITVSFQGDTSTGGLVLGNEYSNIVGTATIQVGSSPLATFTAGPFFFVNPSYSLNGAPIGASGIGASSFTILDTLSDVFKTYNGTTALGPVTGAAYYNPGRIFSTTQGNLILSNVGANSTFTATLGTAVTPEPSSLALLGTGVLGVLGAAKRRHAR